jgi:hypothetical protein
LKASSQATLNIFSTPTTFQFSCNEREIVQRLRLRHNKFTREELG